MNRLPDNPSAPFPGSNWLVTAVMAVMVIVFASAEASGQSVVRRAHRGHHHSPEVSTDSAATVSHTLLPDSIPTGAPVPAGSVVVEDRVSFSGDSLMVSPVDTIGVLTAGEAYEADSIRRGQRNESIMRRLSSIPEDEWVPRAVEFSPDPTRAVWLSALFPGLGQVYNRRYWKLPIIVGGYLGLGYATNWNNQMLSEYSRAYADLLDNDPSSNSYMDFFAPNVKESDIDKSWLQNLLRSRKNYFRRNRDLCIISMVGVYLLAMVDAYVDASLSHFDINPHLSMDVVPALMQDGRQRYPSIGLAWALNF